MKIRIAAGIMAVAVMGNAAHVDAKVNDNFAKRWIERGFIGLDCKGPAQNPADIGIRYSDPENVRKAWAYLKQCRDAGLATSQDAVAAENYLYIRYVANKTGDTAFKIFPWSYYLLKTAGSKAGFLQAMRSNPRNPVSEPDPDVRKWGDQGYNDGIADYEARTGNKASLKADAAEVAWNFLASVFY